MADPVDYFHLYNPSDRLFYYCEKLDEDGDSKNSNFDKEIIECDFDEANLIASICSNGFHKPVLDFDFSCELIPSSTPGCFHLYINKYIDSDKYEKLLLALLDCGLLQKGFVNNSIKRGASFVRPPWIKKPEM